MNKENLTQYLQLAKQSAKLAGDFLINYSNERVEVLDNDGKDIKVNADREAEKLIIDFLKENSDFNILSEEIGEVDNNGDGEMKWIIDPLDGTMNFLRGIPLCVVSVALWKGDEPLLGVIYDFNKDEMYSGIVGVGAWLGDKFITVSEVNNLHESIMTTGFPHHADYNDKPLLEFVKKVQQFKKVRLLGSATLSLAYVACGKAEVYSEKGIRLWDVAGGIAICVAAGGKVEVQDPMGKNKYNIVVTNGLVSLNNN